MGFVHLNVHTSYSLLNSSCKIENLVKAAAKMGMKALAITDENVMYGVIPFYKACKKYNIKPIIGISLAVKGNVDNENEMVHSLLLLAKNEIGYKNLLKLSSIAQTSKGNVVVEEELNLHKEGLFVISPHNGAIQNILLQENLQAAKQLTKRYLEMFGSSFYIGIENHLLQEEKKVNFYLYQLHSELNVPIVAINQVRYVEKKDALAYHCLQAIKNGDKLNQNSEDINSEYYLKNYNEMLQLFSSFPDAINNTLLIADQCNLDIKMGNRVLPRFPLDKKKDAHTFLKEICFKNLKRRYTNPNDEIINRLQYELHIIHKMGFSDYFLIVWDFMKYAHENGILTGPGRGSAAGSIVAYLLNITDVDPIKYDLLFERFLNPERISMPDIDIDFPDNKRDEVIRYVVNKYGKDKVAQIITFGTLKARASIRDVGKVLGANKNTIDQLAKMIPSKLNITLLQAYKETKEIQEFISQSNEAKQIYKIASLIEGLPRHTSTHAAGVVISEEPLTSVIPLDNGNDEVYLTQYPMDILEELGLLKMDFLGLRNLTLISQILKMIEFKEKKKLNLNELAYNDENTFKTLSLGDTTGVFQLESEGMRKVLKRLKPSEFEDIVAVNALYRPGPMDNIPSYIKRKAKLENVTYEHPDLKPILEKTYGVIVYQEQIMQIASVIAGFTLGEADILRRAVSKKKREVLDKEREHFINGCLNNGYDRIVAENVYDLIIRFADYGFNRSHAVAYSMIAYQLAYLKANYPLYFLSALLTSVVGNDDKIREYIKEARQKSILIYPPSINKSNYFFQVENNGIRYSLAAIKGIGLAGIKEIIKERNKRLFTDLFDFCTRVSPRTVNRRNVEYLIYAGAFDEFNRDRSILLASLDRAYEYLELLIKDGDGGLFADDDLIPKPMYVETSHLPLEKKLGLEKLAIGFFLTNVMEDGKYINQFNQITDMHLFPLKSSIRLVAFIDDVKVISTKKGEQMAFLSISDEGSNADAVVFPVQFLKYRSLLTKESFLLMDCEIAERNGNRQLIVQELIPFQKLKEWEKSTLFLKMNKDQGRQGKFQELKTILKEYKGITNVCVVYSETREKQILSSEWRILPTNNCLEKLTKLLGDGHIVLK